MSWKDYFIDNPEHEDMYQAFKDRMAAGEDGEYFDAYDALAEREEREAQEERNDHYCKYEKTEHYRALHAKNRGYEFKPKAYDATAKYK